MYLFTAEKMGLGIAKEEKIQTIEEEV